jgi:pimeloyl-ACP methyl ester carboxylesterase
MLNFLRRSIGAASVLTAAMLIGGPACAEHLRYGWEKLDGLNIFYREGGRVDAPAVVFLHGNPASSIQYEEVMQNLLDARDVRVIAMDYPSFGYSDAPAPGDYDYTFDSLSRTVSAFLKARGVSTYALVMQDYGVPVGFRLMEADRDAVTAVIVQNGVIHLDGFPSAQDETGELRRHWAQRNPENDARRFRSIAAGAFPTAETWDEGPALNPESILLMVASSQRPGVAQARADLWFDYGSNVARYPVWQALLRDLNAPVLVMWGHQDTFFTTPGAFAYLREAPKAEVHVFDGSHFATLEQPDIVSPLLSDFIGRHVAHGGSSSRPAP